TRLAQGTGHMGSVNTYAGSQPVAADFLTVSDCNGDPDCGGLELAAGAFIYSVDLDPLDGDGMEIKVQRNLNAMGNGGSYLDGSTYAADMNLDGILDVVTVSGNTQQRGVYVWNKNGILKFFNIQSQQLLTWFNSACIANVFDDRKRGFQQDLPEIVIAHSYSKMTCLNMNAGSQSAITPWWWQMSIDEISGFPTPSVFDFNADGIAEIVFRDEKNLRIMYGDDAPFPSGVDNNRNWYALPCRSGTGSEYPVIADVDNDDEAEIVTTGFDTNELPADSKGGKLWVVESATIPWAPARNLWNQNNYFVVHINDDLSVPKHQQANHLEFPDLGSGKRPYNTALSQISTLNANANAYLPVPDARAQVDSSACEGGQIRVWLTICNEGSSVLPQGYPYTFYLRDPRQAGATVYGSFVTEHTLPIDSCLRISAAIPAAFNEPFYVVCGDDGTHALPYTLADFPLSAQPECRFENNFANFMIPNLGASLDLGPDIALCENSVVELKANVGFNRYRWHDGSAETSFTAFGPGKYWVDTWDICGYLQTDTVVIGLNTLNSVELGSDVSICAGATYQLNVQGFESVHWTPVAGLSCADCSTPTASPSDTVTYYVTVANGQCISNDSIRIMPVLAPQVSVEVQNGNCLTAATVTASADDQNAVFHWPDGSIGSTLFPVSSGTYTVTATNALGCSTTGSAFVTIDSDLSIEFQTADIPCSGGLGVIRVTGYGGSGDYTFVWSNGATDAFIETPQAGAYTVTMTDATGLCSLSGTVSLALTGNLELSANVEVPSCFGSTDGAIAVASVDGIPPFSWQWAGGQQDSLLSGLPAGIYTVTVTDAVGCTQTAEIALTEPDPLQLLVEAADTLICSGVGASLASAVAGGTPPFNYLWNTGQTEGQLLDAPPGTYVLVVTDAHQCTASASATISEQPIFEVVLDTILPASGPSKADGSIQLSISDQGGPYTYLWNNGDSNLDLESVFPGNYTLTVTDSQGCMQTFVFTVPFTSTSNSPEKPDWTAAIWPNPAGQGSEAQLMVQSPVAQHLDVQVFDARGVLLNRQWLDAQGKMVSMPLVAPPAAGVYFVVLCGNGNVLCLRWRVE
ncbi:MAG: hypothetical protein JNJ57_11890, partial [Saprospiraceae bacterium]|nr:hypothetical protein [Saprospiraceae bacterium]